MDDTQLALIWVGWPNGNKKKTCFDMRANWTWDDLRSLWSSHRKSTQVHASPGQTESQVDPSFQRASTCDSVWPWL